MKTEHEEQRELVKWFRQTFPGVLIFAIPNGGGRSISQAAKLKCEGVVRGIPDLFIPEWRLFIEMKRQKGGIVSDDQKSVKNYLQSVNYFVIVCAGCEEAQRQIKEFKA